MARSRSSRPRSKEEDRAGFEVPRDRGAVLIVDDDFDFRDSLERYLRLEGYTVHTASNGAEALELASLVKPRAVFCDIQMPLMDGIAVGMSLRAVYGERVRLVALTGLPARRVWASAMDAGFDYYLQKPFDPETLVEYIEQPLAPREDDGAP